MSYRIVLLPGDGIGPEVVEAARQVLEAAASLTGLQLEFSPARVGGSAMDSEGTPLPRTTLELCRQSDAILLGAVGGPRWSDPQATVRPEQALLQLRQEFQLFANLRPVRSWHGLDSKIFKPSHLEDLDLLIVRELTSGLYYGKRAEDNGDGTAFDTLTYRVEEVERVARLAFELARERKGKVTSVDKANVLASMRLWRRTVERVARDYPQVQLEHALVDSCAMRLVSDPKAFDVILAGNLFGDILSDEAAVLSGSLGLLPSVSRGDKAPFLYEPVHGSAPDIAGQHLANPVGAILSAALLVEHSLGQGDLAQRISQGVGQCLKAGICTPDLGGEASTEEFTAAVITSLTSNYVS